tara:strand:+ start:80 stop:496 length:417 start_codon:yes stop_codon:yes gene_type:complete
MGDEEKNLEFIKYLNNLDLNPKEHNLKQGDINNIELAFNSFFGITDVKWVNNGNSEVKEFYCSEINKPWLYSFTHYYEMFLKDTPEDSVYLNDLNTRCLMMLYVMLYVKGVNIVDNVAYLLESDVVFVNYNIKKQIFI